jgi:hypothetical protein
VKKREREIGTLIDQVVHVHNNKNKSNNNI